MVCPACGIPAKIVTDQVLRCPHCFREGHFSTFEIGPWYSTRDFFERVERVTAQKLERLQRIIQKECDVMFNVGDKVTVNKIIFEQNPNKSLANHLAAANVLLPYLGRTGKVLFAGPSYPAIGVGFGPDDFQCFVKAELELKREGQ